MLERAAKLAVVRRQGQPDRRLVDSAEMVAGQQPLQVADFLFGPTLIALRQVQLRLRLLGVSGQALHFRLGRLRPGHGGGQALFSPLQFLRERIPLELIEFALKHRIPIRPISILLTQARVLVHPGQALFGPAAAHFRRRFAVQQALIQRGIHVRQARLIEAAQQRAGGFKFDLGAITKEGYALLLDKCLQFMPLGALDYACHPRQRVELVDTDNSRRVIGIHFRCQPSSASKAASMSSSLGRSASGSVSRLPPLST